MHAALVAMMIVAGGGASPETQVPTVVTAPARVCTQCNAPASRNVCLWDFKGVRLARDWFGPMPQTCYSPRYGCYPGNTRYTHRYPAFHGYSERQAYNYRHYLEYPWHAEPHEPQPFFTYSAPVDGEVVGSETVSEPQTPTEALPSPPAPTPAEPPMPPMPSGT